MKERPTRRTKQYLITVWLGLAVLSMAGMIVYAAYTSTHTAKSVIATRGGAATPFSSNHLLQGIPIKVPVSINSADDDPSISVTVCNYPQDNPAKFYSDTITYDLTAVLVNEDNVPYTEADVPADFPDDWYTGYFIKSGGQTVQFDGDTLTAVFRDMALAGDEQSTDIYVVHYPQSQLEDRNVFVRLTATPHAPQLGRDSISEISAYLGIMPKDVETITGWNGTFTNSDAIPPSSYDGFNYMVSGTGQADITLSWDIRYVYIGKWFLEQQALTETNDPDDANRRMISFRADSSEISSYQIPFYRRQAPDDSESWGMDERGNLICVRTIAPDNVISYVTCVSKAVDTGE